MPAELGDPGTSSLQIHVDGGDMNDFIEIDAVFYREAVLEGGEGADELQGGGSLNILDGGPGSDTFRPGFQGSYQNVVDYSSRTNPVSVSIGDGAANDGEAGEQDLIEDGIGRVWGGSGNDFISAHAEGFISFDLFGRGGDDTVTVDSGDSFLYGGSGNDTLVALCRPRRGSGSRAETAMISCTARGPMSSRAETETTVYVWGMLTASVGPAPINFGLGQAITSWEAAAGPTRSLHVTARRIPSTAMSATTVLASITMTV